MTPCPAVKPEAAAAMGAVVEQHPECLMVAFHHADSATMVIALRRETGIEWSINRPAAPEFLDQVIAGSDVPHDRILSIDLVELVGVDPKSVN